MNLFRILKKSPFRVLAANDTSIMMSHSTTMRTDFMKTEVFPSGKFLNLTLGLDGQRAFVLEMSPTEAKKLIERLNEGLVSLGEK